MCKVRFILYNIHTTVRGTAQIADKDKKIRCITCFAMFLY